MSSSLSDNLKDITIPENKPPLGEAASVNVSVMCESPLPSTSDLAAAGKRPDSLDIGDQEGMCSSFQLFFGGVLTTLPYHRVVDTSPVGLGTPKGLGLINNFKHFEGTVPVGGHSSENVLPKTI